MTLIHTCYTCGYTIESALNECWGAYSFNREIAYLCPACARDVKKHLDIDHDLYIKRREKA